MLRRTKYDKISTYGAEEIWVWFDDSSHAACWHFFLHWKPDCKLNGASERHCQMQCDSPPLRRTKTCLRSVWHRMQYLRFRIFWQIGLNTNVKIVMPKEKKKTRHWVTLLEISFKLIIHKCYSPEALSAQLEGNFYWSQNRSIDLCSVLLIVFPYNTEVIVIWSVLKEKALRRLMETARNYMKMDWWFPPQQYSILISLYRPTAGWLSLA